jgi:MFS family permease
VIALAAPIVLCCPIGWVLAAAPQPHLLTLPLLVVLQLVLGAASAGLDLASGNIALKLAPKGEATVFLGANGLVKSLAAGCAPIAGGVLVDRLSALTTHPALLNGRPWLILFTGAAALGVFALTRLARIEETGDRPLVLLFWAALRALRLRLPAWAFGTKADDVSLG